MKSVIETRQCKVATHMDDFKVSVNQVHVTLDLHVHAY